MSARGKLARVAGLVACGSLLWPVSVPVLGVDMFCGPAGYVMVQLVHPSSADALDRLGTSACASTAYPVVGTGLGIGATGALLGFSGWRSNRRRQRLRAQAQRIPRRPAASRPPATSVPAADAVAARVSALRQQRPD